MTNQSQTRAWTEDDEINLGQYLVILIQWWREIIGFTLLVMLVGMSAVVTIRHLTPDTYTSTATIVIARIKSDVTFDERYRTLSNDDTNLPLTNASSRRAALVGLVANGNIAQSVIAELGDSLLEEDQRPAALLEKISAQVAEGQNGRIESDLIQITVTADSAEKAAMIANSWAKYYVEQVNAIYGQVPVEVVSSVESDLAVAQANYETTQKNLETFVENSQVSRLQRLIEEKQTIIGTLQTGKQTAITTIVEEEINVRSNAISTYINALSQNRLLGFEKEQAAKQMLIHAYIDAEIGNRLQAIEVDQEARKALFEQFTDAQLSSIISVFEQQVQGNVAQLGYLYEERSRIQGILDRAIVLQQQIISGGDAATETNAVGLILLKSQIFALPERRSEEVDKEDTPQDSVAESSNNPIQFNVDISPNTSSNAADQLQDVTALISALQTYAARTDQDIQDVSQKLIAGDEYQFLNQLTVDGLGASSSFTQTLATIPQDSDELVTETAGTVGLSDAIVQRYQDLFGLGGLNELSQELADGSALMAQIEHLYPELFTLGTLSQLTENVSEDSPLAMVGIEKIQELLQLQGLEDIPEYTEAAKPLIQAIDQLENEIQRLEAQLEAESSRRRQLAQQRDLAWETYKTLGNKATELNLAQSATNSEVRLAAPAVPPLSPIEQVDPITSTALSGVVGLLLGIFMAFLAHFMNKEPFLSSRKISESV